MTDTAEDIPFRTRYEHDLQAWLVEAAVEADGRLQPARIGSGWGESTIGVYRRETRDGRDVLGEVPDHPIDPTVGVIRVDDLDGQPIATVFRYSAHPVTVGSRSLVASSDYPGPRGRCWSATWAASPSSCRAAAATSTPASGSATRSTAATPRTGSAWSSAARRSRSRPGSAQTRAPANGDRSGTCPTSSSPPGSPSQATPAPTSRRPRPPSVSTTTELPSPDEARAILEHWRRTAEERRNGDALDWEIRAAQKYEHWARKLVAAVEDGNPTHDLHIQAIRVNDIVIVAMNMEVFFETGLEIRDRSPLADTFVLGYTNGCFGYLPRGEDYPEGGWKVDASYALPDLLPQAWAMPVILREDSAQRAVEASVELIREL